MTCPALWAIGEVACTGLHGANRMASNSLLECLVQARACGEALGQPRRADEPRLTTTLDSLMPQHAALLTQLADNGQVWRCVMRLSTDEARMRLERLRQLMSLQAGIERSQQGLREALEQMARWVTPTVQSEEETAAKPGLDHLALYQALTLAPLLLLSAHQRHESRGLHFIRDFPMPAPRARDSIVRLSAFAATP